MMNITLTDLVFLVLATAQVIEIFHHSSICAGMRARLENFDNFVGDLFSCMFCLSVWVAAILTVGYFFAAEHPAWRLPVYVLAVTRGANLLNDVFYRHCRTPRASELFEDE